MGTWIATNNTPKEICEWWTGCANYPDKLFCYDDGTSTTFLGRLCSTHVVNAKEFCWCNRRARNQDHSYYCPLSKRKDND